MGKGLQYGIWVLYIIVSLIYIYWETEEWDIRVRRQARGVVSPLTREWLLSSSSASCTSHWSSASSSTWRMNGATFSSKIWRSVRETNCLIEVWSINILVTAQLQLQKCRTLLYTGEERVLLHHRVKIKMERNPFPSIKSNTPTILITPYHTILKLENQFKTWNCNHSLQSNNWIWNYFITYIIDNNVNGVPLTWPRM